MNAIAHFLTVDQLDAIDPPTGTALAIAFVDLTFDYVVKVTGVSANDMRARRRTPDIVAARAMFVWLVKHYRPGISYPAIGRWLDNHCHGTLINLHTRATRLRLDDPVFQASCDRFVMACRREREVPYACD